MGDGFGSTPFLKLFSFGGDFFCPDACRHRDDGTVVFFLLLSR
uniref:Uncharacterized protein n=1 Tax=Anguilla anguilla TaxID=7936 RepID=A0A0E9W3I1_ANGAN